MTFPHATSSGSSAAAVPVVTWNPSDKSSVISLSNGDLRATKITDTNFASVRATRGVSIGKWYFEIVVVQGNTQQLVGVGNSSANLNSYCGSDANGWSYHKIDGNKINNAVAVAYGATWPLNATVIGIALDMTGGKLWWAKNNAWQASGDPAAGTNPAYSTGLTGTLYPMLTLQANAAVQDIVDGRFKLADFSNTPPTGFSAWGS